ncbi:PREDICTED: uncharacterized protein LOC108755168 [Trachymyrmex septentrionalis]|uniref:uncharacterized protein LOC108755168 n=1 Tax=Trachymyrmex septentrionalis TaxID=34720 RepID=UPI00084ED726|nr:PREDICTED: uncharacterized protein LOC108755168 [Trachymyrmex septentrionalis]
MSCSMTIRSQIAVNRLSSAIVVNTGYLKSWNCILKMLQLALGIVCIGIVGYEFSNSIISRNIAELFFLLIMTTFMISTFIVLLSCLASLYTANTIPKTLWELLYHAVAFGLILAASLTLLVNIHNNSKRSRGYELLFGASICGLINTALYLLSTIIALHTYRENC